MSPSMLNSKTLHKTALLTAMLATLLASPLALGLDQVVRPYQSVRSSGMGSVKLTTGLYDENFFGNPARVTANPRFRFTLVDPMVETNTNAIDRVGDFTSSGDPMKKFGDSAGKNNHLRIQTTMPSFYIPVGENGKWAFAFGFLTSTQVDLDLRRSYRVDPAGVVDVGPAFTIGRRFMRNENLSIGMTTHLTYRVATNGDRSMADLLKNSSFAVKDFGRDGSMVDFDLGATYVTPWHFLGFSYQTAVVFNNVLDGKYSNLKFHPINAGALPRQQPRTLGLGVAARKDSLWKFTNFALALEFTDIGNNPNGSLFRTVHLGSEARYGILLPRLGINQGYPTAGLGVDLRFFTVDLAYYAEEMALNPGVMPDHRLAMKIALQI